MAIKVLDPGKSLPPGVEALLPAGLDGTLVAPDRQVPLHPESVKRFLSHMQADRSVCFLPEIPVATELGLPRYEPLLYWVPAPRNMTGRVRARLRQALRRLRGPVVPPLPPSCERMADLNKEEQVHYFADHIHVIAPKPIQVSVVVSNACNLTCIMCPYHSPAIRPTHKTDFFEDRILMPWAMLDRLATECGVSRIPVKIGNVEEPLLHHRIVDFVRACRNRGVPSVHITTNGVPLTEDLAVQLLDAGLTSLYVSLDASRPETYQRIRGSDLERVETNVRSFLRLRRERNAPCSVMLSFVRNRGVSDEEIAEFRERWLRESDGVIFYNLAEYNSGNSQFTAINEVANSMMQQVGGRWPCLNPWQEMYVLPDGRVYYCCETVSKLAFESLESMGKFPEQQLLDIWRGDLFSALRRDLLLNQLDQWSACKHCGIWMAHVAASTVQDGIRTTTNMITEIVQCQGQ